LNRSYVDTSVLVAIALGEPGAERLRRRLARFGAVFAGGLLEAEFRSAVARENVEGEAAEAHLRRISFVEPPRRMTAEISRALAVRRLRGADLWHVACALYLSPDPHELAFLTLDADQRFVARKLGFRSR